MVSHVSSSFKDFSGTEVLLTPDSNFSNSTLMGTRSWLLYLECVGLVAEYLLITLALPLFVSGNTLRSSFGYDGWEGVSLNGDNTKSIPSFSTSPVCFCFNRVGSDSLFLSLQSGSGEGGNVGFCCCCCSVCEGRCSGGNWKLGDTLTEELESSYSLIGEDW